MIATTKQHLIRVREVDFWIARNGYTTAINLSIVTIKVARVDPTRPICAIANLK